MDEQAKIRRLQAMRGFSVVEVIVVMVVIGIISTFAVLGITRSRNAVKLQNSARLFSSYLEKARVDAIRRHDGTNVDITGPNTYSVTMDFDGRGTVVERSFTLERGVVFTDSTNTPYTGSAGFAVSSNGEPVSWADFNWRGRTSQCAMLFRMQNSNNERSIVQLAGSGDITIDSTITTPATATTSTVSPSSDVVSTAVVTGTAGARPELNPCNTSSSGSGSGTPIVPPVASCPGGSISASVATVSVRKNSGSTATVNISVTGPGTITTTANSNLQVTPATRDVTSSSGGTFSFSIRSITRLRASNPPFSVVFRNPCSSVTIYVTVTN